MTHPRWSQIGLVLGAWSAAGLLFGIHRYVGSILREAPITWGFHVTKTFILWQAWALLTPFVLWLSRRYPLDQRWAPRRVAAHLCGIALCAMIYSALEILVVPLFEVPGAPRQWPFFAANGLEAFRFSLEDRTHWNAFIYAGIVASDHAREFSRRARERRLRATQLQAQLSRAQLTALRAQLHPHFLFNTLNTISALLYRDPDAAGRMLVRLSELFRASLQATDRHEVPLREELAFLAGYLEIQQMRFQDRLTVRLAVEPATLGASVASLMLQPLVENAIRHGIARNPQPGFVEIRARRDGDVLRVEVRDSGSSEPREASTETGRGLGLANVRERLAHLYGPSAQLQLRALEEGGTSAGIAIPFRLLEPPLDDGARAEASYELRSRPLAPPAVASSPGRS